MDKIKKLIKYINKYKIIQIMTKNKRRKKLSETNIKINNFMLQRG